MNINTIDRFAVKFSQLMTSPTKLSFDLYNEINSMTARLKVYCESTVSVRLEYTHSNGHSSCMYFSQINTFKLCMQEYINVTKGFLSMSDSVVKEIKCIPRLKLQFSLLSPRAVSGSFDRIYNSMELYKIETQGMSISQEIPVDSNIQKIALNIDDAVNSALLADKQLSTDHVHLYNKKHESFRTPIDDNKYKFITYVEDSAVQTGGKIYIYTYNKEFYYIAESESIYATIKNNIHALDKIIFFVYKKCKFKTASTVLNDIDKELGIHIKQLCTDESADDEYTLLYKNLFIHYSPDRLTNCSDLISVLMTCLIYSTTEMAKLDKVYFETDDIYISFSTAYLDGLYRTPDYAWVIGISQKSGLSLTEPRDCILDNIKFLRSTSDISHLLEKYPYLYEELEEFVLNNSHYKLFYSIYGYTKRVVCVLKDGKECRPTREILKYANLYK